MGLQRLVIEFKAEELVVRTLYRSNLDGPAPNTKARAGEVSELTREGLRQALVSLETDAALVGCSGFTQREDVLLVDAREEGSAA
jgi:hypothetical protein